MKIYENLQKSIEIYEIYENLWKSMKNLWKYMKTYENLGQSSTPFNKISLHERRRDGAAFFTWSIDLIFSLFWYFEKSVLYLTYNATAASRHNGIFRSGTKFAPGVGTIHLASFGIV